MKKEQLAVLNLPSSFLSNQAICIIAGKHISNDFGMQQPVIQKIFYDLYVANASATNQTDFLKTY